MREFFPDLLGNEDTKKRLGLALESGRIPHAFLIDGPEGSGKLTLALEISAALLCQRAKDSGSALPCGKCDACRKVLGDGHTDVKILRKQPDKATIGVGEIKTFRADMFLSATESEYKVYIICDAEKLTVEAQNALLIILEEPPEKVKIMLLASGCDKILTTIKSRAQYISMSRFSPDELAEYITKKNPDARRMSMEDPETFKAMMYSADGRIGKALALMTPSRKKENERRREDVFRLLNSFPAKVPFATLYSALMSLPDKRVELMEVFEDLITALRDMIAIRQAPDVQPLFFLTGTEAEKYAKDVGARRILQIYDVINAAHGECAKNANVTALLTTLATKIKKI